MFGGITTACPQCGRQHVTVFKLRHISDSFFRKLGEFYQYSKHADDDGQECSNSGKSPDWGGPAAPPR
jgi:hypothetical protein